MTRKNNRKGALMRTPDVTCECGHRSHGRGYRGEDPGCYFCDCPGFTPRDRSIPSQPTKYAGTHARLPIHKLTARKNEDAT